MPDAIVDVAVGVLLTRNHQVLLGDRPSGKPWAGWWELPGGKLEPGESVMQALARELNEELDIKITAATPWVTYVHHYPTTTVRLHFCRVTAWDGEPQGLEGQQLKWVDVTAATSLPDLLPATYPPLRWLQIPDRYLISPGQGEAGFEAFLSRLSLALERGVRLVQWREPTWCGPNMHNAFETVLAQCHRVGAKLLINSAHDQAMWTLADGVHFRCADAARLEQRPAALTDVTVAVSTHNETELHMARAFGADFVVLGPVLPTASHPGAPTLGWEAFERLQQHAGMPVFAIGGQRASTLPQAQSRGAHGVAGIRELIDGPTTTEGSH